MTTTQEREAQARTDSRWEVVTRDLVRLGFRPDRADWLSLSITAPGSDLAACRVVRDDNTITVHAYTVHEMEKWSAEFTDAPEFLVTTTVMHAMVGS